MDPLAPCPFCGNSDQENLLVLEHHVECQWCFACGPYAEAEAGVVELWNCLRFTLTTGSLPGDTISSQEACGQEAQSQPAEMDGTDRDAEGSQKQQHRSNEPE